jgi:hypothetical protein
MKGKRPPHASQQAFAGVSACSARRNFVGATPLLRTSRFPSSHPSLVERFTVQSEKAARNLEWHPSLHPSRTLTGLRTGVPPRETDRPGREEPYMAHYGRCQSSKSAATRRHPLDRRSCRLGLVRPESGRYAVEQHATA